VQIDDYAVRLISLPGSVEGVTVVDSEGFCNIYINASLSYEARKRVVAHELGHAARDDFYSGDDIRDIEA